MVLVTIKWNKFTYSNISLDISQSIEIFKIQIFSLTGVPPERQKLISKGNWIGTLKDTADLSTMNIKEGSIIMLMGTADIVIPPVSQVTFLEDLNEEEKAVKGTVNPSGLQNLGNTCYMNSTIECLRHMPELREAFNRVYPTGPAQNFTIALRETFNTLDRSTQAVPPIEFVVMLRSMFPQFAQTTQQGAYMQQDAEEFYTILIQTLQSGLQTSSSSSSLSTSSSPLNNLITFEVEDTLTCTESSDEPAIVRTEIVSKLVCNIQGGAGQNTSTSNQSNISVNHLSEGLNLSLNGTIEKYSEVLQRNAIWKKQQKISKLPKYLCIQFMRFYWKLTPESMDHTGVKCKIMRPVTYNEVFDIYDYCTESLQQKLRVNRDIAEKKREEYYNKRTRILESVSETAPTDDMEVIKESSTETKTESENLPQPPPSSSLSSSSSQLDSSSSNSGDPTADDIRGLYELVGVVTHKGRSADSGHYIGWVRSNTDHSIWWKYDDNVVTQVTLQEILNLKGGGDWHTAYLNFYRLRE